MVTGKSGDSFQLSAEQLDLLRPSLAPQYSVLADEDLLAVLDTTLQDLSPEDLEALLEVLEVNWGKLLGGALGGAGSGAAMGTAVMPGWGTAIGAGLGALSGILGGALGGKKTPRPVPPATATRPVGPGPKPTSSPVRPAGQRPPARSPANAILRALQNPVVLKAVASAILGAMGRKDVDLPASGVRVSNLAVLNGLREMLDRAVAEMEESDRIDPEDYLKDNAGQYVVDPNNAEARAERLFDLLEIETLALHEALQSPQVLASIGEALIEPLSTHLSNRARFRAGVATTAVFPFSAICQLRMQMSRRGSSWFIGTGFYIGPNRILTAGHNILHRKHGSATRMIVTPARNGAATPFGSFEVQPSAMVAHPNWRANPISADFDIAVLKVRNGPPNGEFFGLEELRFTPETGVAVCGYAADRAAGVDPNHQNIDYDTIRDLNRESFTYSLNTTGGTSGSPVFYITNGVVRAVGIHSRTNNRHTNRGCRLTDSKISWIHAVADDGLPRDAEPTTIEDPQDVIPMLREEHFKSNDSFIPANVDEEAAMDVLVEMGAFSWEQHRAIAMDAPSNPGNYRMLTSGIWTSNTSLTVQGGQGMWFKIRNDNALGTTISISDQHGQSKSSIIPPFSSVEFLFANFGIEPMGWRFDVSTNSDVFMVTWELWSTWVKDMPRNDEEVGGHRGFEEEAALDALAEMGAFPQDPE